MPFLPDIGPIRLEYLILTSKRLILRLEMGRPSPTFWGHQEGRWRAITCSDWRVALSGLLLPLIDDCDTGARAVAVLLVPRQCGLSLVLASPPL